MTSSAENPPPDKPGFSKQRRRRIVVWLGFWFVIFVMTHIPIERSGRPTIPHADKAVHLVAYFVLALLGGRIVLRGSTSSVRAKLWFWAGAYAVYGVVDECTQPFVNRTATLGDWLADVIGVLLATWILITAAKRGVGTATPPRNVAGTDS